MQCSMVLVSLAVCSSSIIKYLQAKNSSLQDLYQFPFSSQLDAFAVEHGIEHMPFIFIDPRWLSCTVLVLGSENFTETCSASGCCCGINSMCLRAGTSPQQYLCHMFLYVDSSPFVKFAPSQTCDFIISSLRVILSSAKAGTSEASCKASWTYSSSVLAIKCPSPAFTAYQTFTHCIKIIMMIMIFNKN